MNDTFAIQLNHLQHVGIPVTDIRVSEAFYMRLGFTNVMQSTFVLDGQEGTCIMMRNNSIIVELYQLPAPRLDGIKNRKDGHIDHIAFDVDDIDLAFAAAQKAGFTLLDTSPVFLSFWEKGCRFFNIAGPDGERLEFNQVIK